jgi:hypothetical protein
VSLGAGIWSVLLQHGLFKRGTEQKLVCAKGSGEIALVPKLYGICSANVYAVSANVQKMV